MIDINDIPGRQERIEEYISFQQYERNGRSYFTEFTKTLKDVEINKYSKKEYSPWDVSYTSGGTKIIGEIKVRNEKPNKYNDWLLQKNKYDELQQLLKAYTGAHIHYINIYNDGSIRIWDISNLNTTKWQSKYNPSTTCGNNEYKKKEVTFLNVKDTIKVKKKDE